MRFWNRWWRIIGNWEFDMSVRISSCAANSSSGQVWLTGGYSLTHFDEFIDELLTQDRVCDIILPRLTQRAVLEETEGLAPRKSLLVRYSIFLKSWSRDKIKSWWFRTKTQKWIKQKHQMEKKEIIGIGRDVIVTLQENHHPIYVVDLDLDHDRSRLLDQDMFRDHLLDLDLDLGLWKVKKEILEVDIYREVLLYHLIGHWMTEVKGKMGN